MYPFSLGGDADAIHRVGQGKSELGNQNLSQSLNRGSDFQEVSVTKGGNPRVLEDPGHIQLRGPVRQVVTSTVQGESKISSLSPSSLSN